METNHQKKKRLRKTISLAIACCMAGVSTLPCTIPITAYAATENTADEQGLIKTKNPELFSTNDSNTDSNEKIKTENSELFVSNTNSSSEQVAGYAMSASNDNAYSAITLETNKDCIYLDEIFEYRLKIQIPNQNDESKYVRFIIEDELPEQFALTDSSAISLKEDEQQQNITSLFINNSSNEKVELSSVFQTLEENGLCGAEIEICIPVYVKNSADFSKLAVEKNIRNNGTIVTNKAKVGVLMENDSDIWQESNEVDIAVSSKTEVRAIDGTYELIPSAGQAELNSDDDKTQIYKVPAGTTQTYKFKTNYGYRLKALAVNGENVKDSAFSDENTLEYSIPSSSSNNDISVECEAIGYIQVITLLFTNATPVNGAIYGIYSDAACTDLIETLTTTNNGRAITQYLLCGTYYIKELHTLSGYQENNEVSELTIENPGDVVNKTVKLKELPAQPANPGTRIDVESPITKNPSSSTKSNQENKKNNLPNITAPKQNKQESSKLTQLTTTISNTQFPQSQSDSVPSSQEILTESDNTTPNNESETSNNSSDDERIQYEIYDDYNNSEQTTSNTDEDNEQIKVINSEDIDPDFGVDSQSHSFIAFIGTLIIGWFFIFLKHKRFFPLKRKK